VNSTNTVRMTRAGAILALLLGGAAWAQPPAQAVTNLTVTGVSVADQSGQLVAIVVSQRVVAGCTNADYYVVRDPNIINGALALATTALVSGQPVNLYISGACDAATGEVLATIVNIS
jgi:hypothetical protein